MGLHMAAMPPMAHDAVETGTDLAHMLQPMCCWYLMVCAGLFLSGKVTKEGVGREDL